MIRTYGEVNVSLVEESINGFKYTHEYQLVFHGNKLRLHTYRLSVNLKDNPYSDTKYTQLVFVADGYLNSLSRDGIPLNKDKFAKIFWSHIKSLKDVKVPEEVIAAAKKRLKRIK